MSNLQEFNQTLEDFNQEVERLKDVSGAYKKLQQLTETFDENSKTLDAINERHKVLLDKVANSLTELENANKQNKKELAKLVEEKTDQIRKDNKEFYKELEGTIKIKLDDNKSQIKQLIESERNQIKQIFEIEIAKHTNAFKQVVENETKKLAGGQKAIKLSLWVICGLTLIFSAFIAFKLLS